jgi:hypothetical protein
MSAEKTAAPPTIEKIKDDHGLFKKICLGLDDSDATWKRLGPAIEDRIKKPEDDYHYTEEWHREIEVCRRDTKVATAITTIIQTNPTCSLLVFVECLEQIGKPALAQLVLDKLGLAELRQKPKDQEPKPEYAIAGKLVPEPATLSEWLRLLHHDWRNVSREISPLEAAQSKQANSEVGRMVKEFMANRIKRSEFDWSVPDEAAELRQQQSRATFTKFAAAIDANAKKIAALEKELAWARQRLAELPPKPE